MAPRKALLAVFGEGACSLSPGVLHWWQRGDLLLTYWVHFQLLMLLFAKYQGWGVGEGGRGAGMVIAT